MEFNFTIQLKPMENSSVFSFYFYISIHLLFDADSSQKLDCSYSASQCMKASDIPTANYVEFLSNQATSKQTPGCQISTRLVGSSRQRRIESLRISAENGEETLWTPACPKTSFLNVLVTVQTEMFDWVWTETRHSNATWELTPLPCETKQTVTFLNSAVVPLQLEHSHFTKTFIILGSVSEFGWQIMLPSSV